MKAVSEHILNSAFMAMGLGSAGFGFWLVYEPLAYITVGVALMWMGFPEKRLQQ